jgi:hypothetical protein
MNKEIGKQCKIATFTTVHRVVVTPDQIETLRKGAKPTVEEDDGDIYIVLDHVQLCENVETTTTLTRIEEPQTMDDRRAIVRCYIN